MNESARSEFFILLRIVKVTKKRLTFPIKTYCVKNLLFISFILVLIACNQSKKEENKHHDTITTKEYFNYSDTGVESAGIKLIPITTPVGNFKVWTKRFGNNPRIKVLLLHGGPAMTHEYMECFESFFPNEGFEFYEYDQLGSS